MFMKPFYLHRENDGEAMLAFWRCDSVDFWENNHTKYLILAHRFIAGNKFLFFKQSIIMPTKH